MADVIIGNYYAALSFEFKVECLSPAGESIKANEEFFVDPENSFVWVKPDG